MPCRPNYKKKSFLALSREKSQMCVYLDPFVSFCTARTLRTHLVKAKVYPAKQRLVGSRKCLRNRCQVCKNVVETATFQSFQTKMFIRLMADSHVVIM